MTSYTVIPVEELLPGEPCERWPGPLANHYCKAYNGCNRGVTFEAHGYDLNCADSTHAIVALPRPSKAPESPRYVVKRAEEMVRGEPYLDAGSVEAMRQKPADNIEAEATRCRRWCASWTFGSESFAAYFVDLHDAWHRARTKLAECGIASVTPIGDAVMEWQVTPEPAGPSDGDIVRQYGEMQSADKGWNRSGIHVFHRGTSTLVPMAEVRAAWSRVLASRLAASKERDRRIVLGPIDDPEEA